MAGALHGFHARSRQTLMRRVPSRQTWCRSYIVPQLFTSKVKLIAITAALRLSDQPSTMAQEPDIPAVAGTISLFAGSGVTGCPAGFSGRASSFPRQDVRGTSPGQQGRLRERHCRHGRQLGLPGNHAKWKSDMFDCLIVGGGPAGLTAALYLARFLRSVKVIDAQEGRARMIPETHNLGPFPDGISGDELLRRMRSHAELYGAAIETGRVRSVERQGDVFRVTTDRQVESGRHVILACGVFNHRPPLSPADHERGLSRGLIRYCPVCDAYEIRDMRVAVLGEGEHAFHEAQFLRQYSTSVTLIPPNGSTPVVARDGIDVLDGQMERLSLSDSHVAVKLHCGDIQHFDTLYVALGTSASTGVATGLGVHLAEDGCITVDAKQKTNINGVYAIGDVTAGLDQIAVAMSQGAVAATAIHNDLPRATPGPT